MDTELGRTVISALSTLSGMVIAYRSRSESNKVLAEQEVGAVSASTTDRGAGVQTLTSSHQMSSIKSSRKRRPSPEAGQALASIMPDNSLREIFDHVDSETARVQESIADPSRSKARRQRDLDHAEAKFALS